MKPTKKHLAAKRVRKKLYPVVVERDGGCCVVCGAQGNSVHEIVPRSQTSNPYTEENMAVLCAQCHAWAHTKRARVILQSIMASKHGYDFEIIDMDEDLRRCGLKRLTEEV